VFRLLRRRKKKAISPAVPTLFTFVLPERAADQRFLVRLNGTLVRGDRLIIRVTEVSLIPMDGDVCPSERQLAPLASEPLIVIDSIRTSYR